MTNTSNSFVNAVRYEANRDANHTYTENGADALASTFDPCVDLFATIGAMRNRDESDLLDLVSKAYAADPLIATRIIFYGRDIRGGLGERKAFRTAVKWLAENHPDTVCKNMQFIGEYGRYDDLYELIGTQCESKMWSYMKTVFENDLAAMKANKPVTLLAKWIKTPDASSEKTAKLGCLTARKLGYSVYDFKRLLRSLRKYITIVEAQMSANEWSDINYEAVPSRAAMLHRKAFIRHDEDRYNKYIESVNNGTATIHADTLYPYDIAEKFINSEETYFNHAKELTEAEKKVLEAQWNALPDFVDPDTNCLIMADTSGSMECNDGRPLATSVSLAIYFAERTKGVFSNLFMTFSSTPKFVEIKGDTLEEKIRTTKKAPWGGNTDLEAAFRRMIYVAKKANAAQSEMPDSLIIISDMQFDEAVYNRNIDNWQTYYDTISNMFINAGYKMPNIVFWNVNARTTTFHSDSEHKGVQLVSGSSPSVFKSLTESIGLSPREYMLSVINSDRYADITV